MALAAKLYRLDNRQSDRLSVEVDATVRAAAAQPIDATIADVSETGFRAWIEQEVPIGAEISIGLPGVGVIEACVVRREGNDYGARFLVPITPAAIAKAMSAETVVAFPAVAPPVDYVTGHDSALRVRTDDKLPGWMSLSIIIGSSAVLWGGIIAGVRAAVA
jgi:hypothetical protein